jgi:hypothetical protein
VAAFVVTRPLIRRGRVPLGNFLNILKLLLTVMPHAALVFLEDTPPLPNALGPGSRPASFFFGLPLSVPAADGLAEACAMPLVRFTKKSFSFR